MKNDFIPSGFLKSRVIMKKTWIAFAITFSLGFMGCDKTSNPLDVTENKSDIIQHPTSVENMPIMTRMSIPVEVVLESCLNLTADQKKVCNVNRSEFIEMKISESERIKSLDEIQKAKQSRLEKLDRYDPDYGLKFRLIETEFEGKKHYVEEYTSFWLKSLSQRVSNSFREVMNDRQKRIWNEWIVLNKKPC
jgi:hypothetical protein